MNLQDNELSEQSCFVGNLSTRRTEEVLCFMRFIRIKVLDCSESTVGQVEQLKWTVVHQAHISTSCTVWKEKKTQIEPLLCCGGALTVDLKTDACSFAIL